VSALRRIVTKTKNTAIREVHAVKGVSFIAYEGEAIGIIGSNGSGKSTLLRAIAGLLPANRGKVYTRGQPSLLGVNAALMSDLTGERNVILGCLAMGMTPAEAKAAYQGIVDFSGINERDDFISLPMRTYSSGMAARLRFSISAAKTHDVLMIDEALATGDRSFQQRSEARIRELRKSAGTVFLGALPGATDATRNIDEWRLTTYVQDEWRVGRRLTLNLGLRYDPRAIPTLDEAAALVDLAASTGFALPVATPPNTIVFGSGQIRVKDMARAGLLLDAVAVLLLVAVVALVYPLVFG